MLLTLFLILLFPLNVFAFAENIRHGYINCTTCHVSPAGGGLINDYGRELSRDILSTWGLEGREVQPFYGILPKPSWLNYGGDARYIQTYLDNPYVKQARSFTMQADLEAAVYVKQFTGVGTYGIIRNTRNGVTQETYGSRRHYVIGKLDQEKYVRAGKFNANFGINTPDHIIATKRGLNFDQSNETYNLELGHIGQNLTVMGTAIFGRPDDKVLDKDEGGIVSVSYGFLKSHKVGYNYYKATNNKTRRDIHGIFGIFGFTPSLYLLSEFDLQNSQSKKANSRTIHGLYYYQKLGFEIVQGLHLYASHDLTRANLNLDHNKVYNVGPGIIWYPRPHFEFNASWQKQMNPAISSAFTDFAWITGHYYF